MEITEKEDKDFKEIKEEELEKTCIEFEIPRTHKRYGELKRYFLKILPLEKTALKEYPEKIFIVDQEVSKIEFIKKFLKEENRVWVLPATENKTKTISYLDNFINENKIKDGNKTVIVIGGGLLINCGAYIAEKISSDYIVFPTTILAMADAAIGGKVRVNSISDEKFVKHKYKSFYEPNAVYVDWRFINGDQVRGVELTEIVKHSLFQSKELYNFLIKHKRGKKFDLAFIKKAIIWSIHLKKICLDIDKNESSEGSEIILRAGHNLSDKIEEDRELKITHNNAVSVGMWTQILKEDNSVRKAQAEKIYPLFNLPRTLEEMR